MMQRSLGDRLRRLRAQHGYTLVEAAEKTGVDRGTLSSLERGVHMPYTPTLAKIARGYKIPVEELLEDSPKAEAPTSSPDKEDEERRTVPVGNSISIRWHVEAAREVLHLVAKRQSEGKDISELEEEVGKVFEKHARRLVA